MPHKPPSFWMHKTGMAALLRPFSCLYLAGHRIKTRMTRPYASKIPVLCVGGIVAGGSGKTPIVHAIVALIREKDLFQNPVILTRGYGGDLKGPTLVDPSVHKAKDVGDEALLHAAHAPTIVSRNRAQGAMLAEAMGADLIIMDDGLQNNKLTKTMSFLVVDAQQGLGNGYLLPAGPLREPLTDAAARCAAILYTNGIGHLSAGLPVLTTQRRVVSDHDKSKSYVGFAGLGYPEKFKQTLEENGFTFKGFEFFPDHHPYSAGDIKKLKKTAKDSILITTEKDFVRIPPAQKKGIDVLRIMQIFDQPDEVLDFLKRLKT